jgi:IS5 family transposase
VHHSQPAASLIQGDEKAVYGDKAYASEALRTKLAAAGIEDRVMYRAARDTPLKSWQS